MLPDSVFIQGQEYTRKVDLPPLWMHREDNELDLWNYGLRKCAQGGCPAVMVLHEPRYKVQLTRDWQYYLWAINYNMTPAEVATELDWKLAFCNMTGLTEPGEPRKNFLTNSDLNAPELPKFDKDRTCSRSVMTGTISGDYLKVTVFDGNLPPPLKPGRSRPQRLEDVKLEDYLYNPREHRWMFFAANTVSAKTGGNSSILPFPRGKVYDWTGDGERYTWMPHVSRHTILYPLRYLRKVSTIPSPYRRYP